MPIRGIKESQTMLSYSRWFAVVSGAITWVVMLRRPAPRLRSKVLGPRYGIRRTYSTGRRCCPERGRAASLLTAARA
ncbi:hypothetical protein OBBRIDRAFT_458751 [Obba rivulosa]|uniref:Uncharacterized protein n=1 Tax=Obba rivulosa TaxID=1052685 RepID=A0A8E2DES0_9APHY|nr:hypothetical protein OBBRIDRAFT_458751 [Obba rivulosa]